MRVYLARHGHALTADADARRPLSEHGRVEVQSVAAQLAARGARAAVVEHSGKARAAETAAILAAAIAPGVAVAARGDLDPHEPVDRWALELHDREEDSLLVGHLPFVGRLARALLGRQATADVPSFGTASVLCVERAAGDRWRQVWMVDPGGRPAGPA